MALPILGSAARSVMAGTVVAGLAAALILWPPEIATEARETAIDHVSQLGSAQSAPEVAVVDIDEEAASALGEWPWPRSRLARLVEQLAAVQPRVLALDIVLSGNCNPENPENAALAAAIAKASVTLGFVLSEQNRGPMPPSPIAVHQPLNIPRLWRSDGAELPCPEFLSSATGLGSVSLEGNGSAHVRTAPAVVSAAGILYPGLAADAVRLGTGTHAMILEGKPDVILSVGSLRAHLDEGGGLRFRPSSPGTWSQRTYSALMMMTDASRLAGKIVFIGSSLPQLGGLRPTAASPLAPSVQIQADVASGLLAGSLPWRPAAAPLIEVLALLLAAVLIVLAVLRLRPMRASAATAATAAALPVVAIGAYYVGHLAFDPLLPFLGALGSGLASGLSQYAAARSSAVAIRKSFEQRLPPSVVARLSAEGAGLRLGGEERIITALFTDIEGFTAMTAAADPHDLIRLLDNYYDGVTRIITGSGGMVDKMVGDAVHAFFNMPTALADHPARALECAEAIVSFSESYRQRPEVRRSGFGRTRIGVETGPVIAGDVGSAGKLDYSAYGNAVNLAARLQETNKKTGTSILAGPGLKSSAPAGWTFESLGIYDMRGLGGIEVFSPRRSSRPPE